MRTSLLCLIVFFSALAEAGEVDWNISRACALKVMETLLTGASARTHLYQELDGTYTLTLSHPRLSKDIPLRQYIPETKGFTVVHHHDELTEPTYVDTLPDIYIEKREQILFAEIDEHGDEDDVKLDWGYWMRAFNLSQHQIELCMDTAADKVHVTDNIDIEDLAHHVAIVQSQRAVEVLKLALIKTRKQGDEYCKEARRLLFDPAVTPLMSEIDDPDQINILMLTESLAVMREFRFKEEADERAQKLIEAVGCK